MTTNRTSEAPFRKNMKVKMTEEAVKYGIDKIGRSRVTTGICMTNGIGPHGNIRVVRDGYSEPQSYHPSFWEPLFQ